MVKAIILLSGGIDSTVVLALALKNKRKCHALTFDYGQKHSQEIEAAKQIANYYGISHQIITIHPSGFAGCSLTSDTNCPKGRTEEEIKQGGIPNTYVPARNTLFLAYALGQCEMLQANEIHFGPNAHDYSCYPDCTPSYLQKFQELMNVATKQSIEGGSPLLVTPCLQWYKEEIIRQGLINKAPLELTWSCYSPYLNKPCNQCDACVLRANGFQKAEKTQSSGY